jgi:hypothetical protein
VGDGASTVVLVTTTGPTAALVNGSVTTGTFAVGAAGGELVVAVD